MRGDERDVSTIEISGIIERQTSHAVLFSDGILEEWLPKSRIIEQEDLGKGMVELTIPEWLAIEKGFI